MHQHNQHVHNQALKASEVWGGVKNCAIITPTNTTHYIDLTL